MLANGALIYPRQGEGIVLKAAWHWCSNSIVINFPIVEPGHTALYVGLPSTRGSMDSDHKFPSVSCESFLTGESERYK